MTKLIDIDVYELPVHFLFPITGLPIIKNGKVIHNKEHSCYLRFVIEPARMENGEMRLDDWVQWVTPHTLFECREKTEQENLIRHIRHNNLDAVLYETSSYEFSDLVVFSINYVIPYSPPPVVSNFRTEAMPTVYHWYIGFNFCTPASKNIYLTKVIP